ncbi:MAG: HD-GYP domain-containing protein [Clostridiaceae bacterium]|nr:HD-GYP domain-containing protein [Clostridiaceae bacterium]MBW4858475.1 HD-GYP domain-containing protein [Clostridiaceae bacterium]MBW4868848.1 HD-GYP domain-containing protein [Clostridiaceae bacterium]
MIISINDAIEGMVLAENIYSSDGISLLRKGAILKNSYIENLKENDVKNICIDNESFNKISVEGLVKSATSKEAIIIAKKIINRLPFSQEKNIKEIIFIKEKIIDELLSEKEILKNILNMKTIDNHIFNHCVNVSVISIIIGKSLGYNKEELIKLGKGAMLHDIGKIFIPLEILNKPGKLTKEEYEIVKKHTTFGYEILNKISGVDEELANISLSHHERYDGLGYPNSLKAGDIHEFSSIVAVSDVYDALTSDRIYRKKVKNEEAVEYLFNMKWKQFDGNIIDKFIESVASYSIGRKVILNTGERGIVAEGNKGVPTRPIVKINYDQYNNEIKKPYYIDLLENKSILIENTFN